MLKFWWSIAVALLLAGCGGGTDRTKAQVRMVNAGTGYQQLELTVDDKRVLSAVEYGQGAGYVGVDPDRTRSVITSPGSPTQLATLTPSLSKDRWYTLLAFGNAGALRTLLIDDNGAEPDAGKTFVRVVNAAPDAGPLAFYLTGRGDPLTSAVPLVAGTSFGNASELVTINSGTWQLRITAQGSKTDQRLDLPEVVFGSRQVVTVVLTAGQGGVLVNALLLVQRAGVESLRNGQARVRAVAGVADSGVVTASVGGATLMAATGSPAAGNYALASAGSPRVVASVNGVNVFDDTVSLTAGADYTLLVHGPLGAPLVVALNDENRIPTDATRSKLRLVNGLATAGTTLSLAADFVPIAGAVGVGAATQYGDADATGTGRLTVTAAGLSPPLVDLREQVLVAGGVYSLFVVGPLSTPTGFLRRDR